MELSRAPLRTNIELKARIDDRGGALAICRRIGAEDVREERQEDTYFSMGRYRLKLRESSSGNHSMIGYSRPDSPAAAKSQYRVTEVSDPAATRRTMSKQWGVKVVVRKWRHVFLWEGRVRIHVDQVESLGDFVEFEAVLDADAGYDVDAAQLDIARLSHDFGFEPRDLVATSYSTLIHTAQQIPAGT